MALLLVTGFGVAVNRCLSLEIDTPHLALQATRTSGNGRMTRSAKRGAPDHRPEGTCSSSENRNSLPGHDRLKDMLRRRIGLRRHPVASKRISGFNRRPGPLGRLERAALICCSSWVVDILISSVKVRREHSWLRRTRQDRRGEHVRLGPRSPGKIPSFVIFQELDDG